MWTPRFQRQIQLLAALALVLFILSCTAASPRHDATDQVIDDATIQAKVETELIDDPRIDAEEVDLEVRRGVVTLLGWVGSDNERKAVEDRAWGVAGVKDVDNRLQLRGDEPQAQ